MKYYDIDSKFYELHSKTIKDAILIILKKSSEMQYFDCFIQK